MDDAARAALAERLQRAIDTEYGTRITTRTQAAVLGVSPRWVGQVYMRHAGVTFHAGLTRRRMLEAERLLRAGTKVTAVAVLVGYSASPKNFFRNWRRAHGGTPRQFLRASRGAAAS